MPLAINPIVIKGPWKQDWALDLHTLSGMLWDGLSKGTLNNILNLLERGKKVVVYFSPIGDCKTLRQIPDLLPLLAQCPQSAMDEFESKLDLASRIAPQAQATYDLGMAANL